MVAMANQLLETGSFENFHTGKLEKLDDLYFA